MKLVKRTHRIVAVLAGIAIVVFFLVQILRDGRIIAAARAKQEQRMKAKH